MEDKKEGTNNELDLVFVCDCTGSMSSYIESAKENITSIIEQIQASEKRDVQFALVSYRDHPPQDTSYVTKVFDFTNSVRKAKEYVNTMSADGGGDTAEAVSAALRAALNLPYRKKATKIVVFVADAPPHGLTSYDTGDGFPNGAPDGSDPIVDARAMAEREIVLYSVGCEPALSNSPFARDFFKAIAFITGGRYIALGNAKTLPKVIIGGAEEEIQLNKVTEAVEQEAALVQAEAEANKEALDDDGLYARVTERLQAKGVQTTQLKVDDIGDSEEVSAIAKKIGDCDNLPAVKALLDKEPRPQSGGRASYARDSGGMRKCVRSRSSRTECKETEEKKAAEDFVPLRSPSYECQDARVESSAISYHQVSRMMNKKKVASRNK